MFLSYIERLRGEPPEVRRQAVFWLTTWIVAIIVLIYVAYLFLVPSFMPTAEPENLITPPYQATN
ncbi:MAG: hypothetical protein AAB955_02680 [Patescibacteria group bacterium]